MPTRPLLRFALLPLVLLCASCGKSDEEHRRNADAFAKVLPILEEEGVTFLTYEDRHKVLKYGRGTFFKSENGKYPFTGEASPFDATASSDFDRIWGKISATQADFYQVKGIKRGRGGKITKATFSWGEKGYKTADREQHLYVYSPGYELPDDLMEMGPYDLMHTRIDDDWYYTLKDY